MERFLLLPGSSTGSPTGVSLGPMLSRVVCLSAFSLVLTAGNAAASRGGTTYLYTYYDRNGNMVVNNLPPSYTRGQGLVLKHVGVGHIRLAISRTEMARVLKSPELLAMVDEIATTAGVDPYLARAVIQAESAFNYRARSRTGALGLMQLMPQTAERFGVLDPFDPRQNITGRHQVPALPAGLFQGRSLQDHRRLQRGGRGRGQARRHPPLRRDPGLRPSGHGALHQAAGPGRSQGRRGHGSAEEGPWGLPSGGKAGEDPTGPRLPGTGLPAPASPRRPRSRPRPARPPPSSSGSMPAGRLQISDQPPPKGAKRIRVFDGASED